MAIRSDYFHCPLNSAIAALRSASIWAVIFFSRSSASRTADLRSRMKRRKSASHCWTVAAVNVVEVALGAGEEAHDLVGRAHRLVLRLLEQLDHAIAAVELALGRLVELGAELGERLQLAEGREVEPQAAGHLLHGRDLRLAADARDADADVDRRPDAREEQVGLTR